jgi:DnaJ family protein A protein 2
MGKLYDILGISPDSSPEQIKQAYKQNAMKYHPDKNKDNPEIAEKFKDISNAYNVLSDENERRKYDQLGDDNYNNGSNDQMQGHQSAQDLFEHLFNSGRMGNGFGHGFSHHFSFNNMQNEMNKRCSDLEQQYNVTLEDVYFGINKNLKLTIKNYCKKCNKKCDNCQGSGTVNQIKNMGFITQMYQGPCNKCSSNGFVQKTNSNCSECKGKGTYDVEHNANLSIPKGFDNGMKTIFNNLGEQPKYPDQTPGNLIIQLNIQEHKIFTRKGNDIIYKNEITFIESIVGKDIEIPYFDEVIKLNINQYGIINPTKNYIIKNKGLPIYNTDKKGNIIMEFTIIYPKKIKDDVEISEFKNILEKSFL